MSAADASAPTEVGDRKRQIQALNPADDLSVWDTAAGWSLVAKQTLRGLRHAEDRSSA